MTPRPPVMRIAMGWWIPPDVDGTKPGRRWAASGAVGSAVTHICDAMRKGIGPEMIPASAGRRRPWAGSHAFVDGSDGVKKGREAKTRNDAAPSRDHVWCCYPANEIDQCFCDRDLVSNRDEHGGAIVRDVLRTAGTGRDDCTLTCHCLGHDNAECLSIAGENERITTLHRVPNLRARQLATEDCPVT